MHIASTTTLCPSCPAVVRAELVERDDDVYLEADCPTHGRASALYYRDASLYRALLATRSEAHCCDEFSCAKDEPCTRRSEDSLIFVVNVTNRCNMTCEACFSGLSTTLHEPFKPADELLAHLPDARRLPYQPHAVLLGGEPTLHPELPSIVERLSRRGYIPRLASNGLKLQSPAYTRRLADAGLRWVFLHFDSLDDRLNEQLRGRPMLDACLDAIAQCQAAGMKVQLGTTLSPSNIGELAALLRAAHRAGVFWVSLYPVAEIERTGSAGAIFLADVIAALEQQTGGDVRRSDFVTAARMWSALHRVTGRLNFRQKPTMVSLPLIVDGGRFIPLTRFLNPLAALRQPRAAAKLALSFPSLADYERREPTGETLIVNVQQFQGRRAFDLVEATHSHMSFVHEQSFVPFDVFNHVQRYGVERLVTADRLVRTA